MQYRFIVAAVWREEIYGKDGPRLEVGLASVWASYLLELFIAD